MFPVDIGDLAESQRPQSRRDVAVDALDPEQVKAQWDGRFGLEERRRDRPRGGGLDERDDAADLGDPLLGLAGVRRDRQCECARAAAGLVELRVERGRSRRR